MIERGDGGVRLDVVRQLLESQFPELSHHPTTPLQFGATDNAVFRIGPDLVARLPRNEDAAMRLEKELAWLPAIGRRVTAKVPAVVGIGRPQFGFDYPWAVQRWIEGRDATSTAPSDWHRAAQALGRFVRELRAMNATTGPAPNASNSYRGVPLIELDERVQWGAAFTTEMGSRNRFTAGVDVARVLAIWQEALAAPPWTGAPTWLHGDLLPGNVLLQDGDLAAVIDFGCAGVGDPACDGIAAWTLFRGRAREEFLAATYLDDATQTRARGWAVYVGITAMPYHHLTNPSFCSLARTVLNDLLGQP